MASNTSPSSEQVRPLRRSTRLNHAIPFTVTGVDSYRGPYREEVSTVTISCHGCRYESKHDVLTNSWVLLELPPSKPDDPPVTRRGQVKWAQRSAETGSLYEMAIELEAPSNIWGINNPPADWLAYCGPWDPASTPKPKPFAIRKPEPLPALVTEEKKVMTGDFQRHTEQTLFEAANTVVHERTKSALDEVRAAIRDEARSLLSEAAASQAGTWMTEFVKQMKQASHDTAQSLHSEWNQKINADFQTAGERIEQQTQNLSASAIERVQRGLETSQKEVLTRFVGRLRDEAAPVVGDAKKVAADLNKSREELEKITNQTLEKFSGRIEEVCTRFGKHFEMIIQTRLGAAREVMDRAAEKATNLALTNLQVIAQHNESEARARFQAALEPVAANALIDFKERATEASRQLGDELVQNGSGYLEFIGDAVTDLAKKGFGKPSKE